MGFQESEDIILELKRETLPTDAGIQIEYYLWITNLGNSDIHLVKAVINDNDLTLPADILAEGADINVLLYRTGAVAISQGYGSPPPYKCELSWIDAFGNRQSTSKLFDSYS